MIWLTLISLLKENIMKCLNYINKDIEDLCYGLYVMLML